MNYMEKGGFARNPLMRLTIGLAALLLTGFIISSFVLFFSKMSLTPDSIASYYIGNEEEFIPAKSLPMMIEVTHTHLPMMALVILLLTHLVLFAPFSRRMKYVFITVAFLSGLTNEGVNYLIRFVSPDFAYLKIVSFLSLQASLIFLIVSLFAYLFTTWRRERTLGTSEE